MQLYMTIFLWQFTSFVSEMNQHSCVVSNVLMMNIRSNVLPLLLRLDLGNI